MLSARNIYKSYQLGGKNVPVLHDVNLTIAEGEFVSVTGRSGSGKSTLLNLYSTLIQPDRGHLFYNGIDMTAMAPAAQNELRRSDFAVIFQFHHLLPYLTVLQNTILPFMGTLNPVSRTLQEKAEACLARIGLAEKSNRLPNTLSGGEQQRVAIARAMVKQARVLFADEPTGSLDRKTGEEIMNLLGELHREGLTVIMVTHEPIYAQRADRVVELSDGRVAGQTSQEESRETEFAG